jgi:hypothetical protein
MWAHSRDTGTLCRSRPPGDAMLARAESGSRSAAHCFRSAGQLVIRVRGSVMDCGRTVFITNFLPSAETVNGPLEPVTVVALNRAWGVPSSRLAPSG